eukprot:7929722-Alexandrium_andersonii.AAC.1
MPPRRLPANQPLTTHMPNLASPRSPPPHLPSRATNSTGQPSELRSRPLEAHPSTKSRATCAHHARAKPRPCENLALELARASPLAPTGNKNTGADNSNVPPLNGCPWPGDAAAPLPRRQCAWPLPPVQAARLPSPRGNTQRPKISLQLTGARDPFAGNCR